MSEEQQQEAEATDVTDQAAEATEVTSETTTSEADSTAEETTKGYWPDDWRDHLAGEDEALKKRLQRFQSPGDILTSYRAMEQKLSSGDVKTTLPEDATDEQIAEYRKENGIPETHEGYLDALPDGLVLGEDDQEVAKSFLESAHGRNMPQEHVNAALAWYKSHEEAMASQVAQDDAEYKQKSDDALRAEWGGDYRSNINSIKAFVETAPKDANGTSVGELLMGARLADGTPFGNNPAAMKWVLDLANDVNPAGFVAPGSGLGQIDSIESELAGIKKVMQTNRAAYNKDTKMQERYKTLLDAQLKLKSRA